MIYITVFKNTNLTHIEIEALETTIPLNEKEINMIKHLLFKILNDTLSK